MSVQVSIAAPCLESMQLHNVSISLNSARDSVKFLKGVPTRALAVYAGFFGFN